MVRTSTRTRDHGVVAQNSKSNCSKDMVKIEPRGLSGTHHVLPPMHECNTTEEELTRYLGSREILHLNFTYDFHFIREECHLSENTEGFILPLFLLEVGFNFPLHSSFCSGAKEYGIALGKLSALS